MDLLRLGDLGEEHARLGVADAVLAAHEDECREADAHRLGVHARFVAVDDVSLLELLDAIENRRRRHA